MLKLNRSAPLAWCLGLTLIATQAQAQVTVKDAWVRATVAEQKATGAFMQLTAAQDSKLVAASSPLTPQVEIHEMTMDNHVMKMRQIPALALPAGQAVALKPGGYHVMLLGLKAPLAAGSQVPLSLVIEDKAGQRKTVEVQAEVRTLNTDAGKASGHKGLDKPKGHQH